MSESRPSLPRFGALAIALAGCTAPRFPAKLPAPPYVAVLSGEMPPPLDRVARHSWIVVQPDAGPAHRYEYGSGSGSDPFEDFAAGDVMLHGVIRGTPAEIAALDDCLAAADRDYYVQHPNYFPIPGPNSNTYVAHLERSCELDIELPATAIGRDYVGPVGAAVTEAGTGIQIGSAPFGLRIGLQEGIGVQIFGLPLGVHFFPPGIDLPVNPGRIGFATDGHTQRNSTRSSESAFPDGPARSGVGTATLYAVGLAVVDPERARHLEGEAAIGFSARVVYGKYVGYGAGLDLEMGMAVPAGFAWGAHLYPVGLGVFVSPTGFIGVFGGLGGSGVTDRLPSALELPAEARFEVDLGPRARLTLFGRQAFSVLEPLREQGLFGTGEFTFGLRMRVGDGWGYSRGAYGSGLCFGIERREIALGSMIGLVIGTEIDASYSARTPTPSNPYWR